MKTNLLLATALVGLLAVPVSAHAGNRSEKVWIGVGSFLGGVLIGSHIERHSAPRQPVYYPQHYEPAPSVIVVERPRVYCPPAPSGYWKTIQTRQYVPERWIVATDRCGRRTRILQPGYYTYETQRVWVDTTPVYREEYRGRDRHDDRDDRGYSFQRSDERTDRFAVSDEYRPRSRF